MYSGPKIVLDTPNFILSSVTKEDFPKLFEFRNNPDFLKNCSSRREEISLDKFLTEIEKDFDRDRYMQMLITFKKTNQLAGTIYAYNYNGFDKLAFVTTFLSAPFRKNGYGVEIFIFFNCCLFRNLNLFKIYLEAYEYNKESINLFTAAKFKQEGVFKNHRFFNNQRFNLIRFAIYESDIIRMEQFMNTLRSRKGGDYRGT